MFSDWLQPQPLLIWITLMAFSRKHSLARPSLESVEIRLGQIKWKRTFRGALGEARLLTDMMGVTTGQFKTLEELFYGKRYD